MNEIVTTRNGTQIDPAFDLALIQHFMPECPSDDLDAAEDYFYAVHGEWPDYAVLATKPL